MAVKETGVSYYGMSYVEHARKDFEEMKRHKKYDLILQVGVAGSFDESLKLGEVVLVNADCFADLGAIENKKFDAVLTYIAPKGETENGAIQFEIKASLSNRDDTFIRAGLSANASIILEKVDEVLAIKESLIQFDGKTQKPFVEVETTKQKFARKNLVLGVSDGIYVEVKNGIKASDKIKVWNQGLKTEEPKP